MTSQKSSDFIEGIRQEIASLEKIQAGLSRNVKSLESRESFLKQEIDKLEATFGDIKLERDKATADALKRQEGAEKRLVQANDAITRLENDYKVKQGMLDSNVESARVELGNTNQEIKDRQKVINDLVSQKTNLTGELEDTKEQIRVKNSELERIKGSVVEHRKLADDEIKVIDENVESARLKLKDLNSKIDDTQDMLEVATDKLEELGKKVAAARKNYEDFQEWEVKGKDALKAREESIIERESNLERAIAMSRRRHNILENI